MVEQYKVLNGMLSLADFTVVELARYTEVQTETVRSVLRRMKDDVELVRVEHTGKRGGRPKRYALKEAAAHKLADKLERVRNEISPSERELGSEFELPTALELVLEGLTEHLPNSNGEDELEEILSVLEMHLSSIIRDEGSTEDERRDAKLLKYIVKDVIAGGLAPEAVEERVYALLHGGHSVYRSEVDLVVLDLVMAEPDELTEHIRHSLEDEEYMLVTSHNIMKANANEYNINNKCARIVISYNSSEMDILDDKMINILSCAEWSWALFDEGMDMKLRNTIVESNAFYYPYARQMSADAIRKSICVVGSASRGAGRAPVNRGRKGESGPIQPFLATLHEKYAALKTTSEVEAMALPG